MNRIKDDAERKKSHDGVCCAGLVGMILMMSFGIVHAGETTRRKVAGPRTVLSLPPRPKNPRNSEGDFIRLQDGRVMFVYTHFVSGAGDHAGAYLAARFSDDGGRSWSSRDVVVVRNEGRWNVMSVSLLRLKTGRIALFYARKNSLTDCRPYLRISTDEGQTWSAPKLCISDEVGYYVMNNDRAVQLTTGRLVLPVSLHNKPGDAKPDWNGRVMCYLSDDNGKSWRRSKDQLIATGKSGRRLIAQEPGVVELKDGRLMLFSRSNAGSQLVSFSADRGETWSSLSLSNIISPVSPATIERIPKTGDLILVWNDHRNISRKLRGKRTPYNVAISQDDGRTWTHVKTLQDNPHGWYCYTAVEFVDGHVLLGHCAGDRRKNNGLAETHITRFSLDWLYH